MTVIRSVLFDKSLVGRVKFYNSANFNSHNTLVSIRLAQTDALAKLLIEKGLITREEFMGKVSQERATYQNLITG
jgi:hypothetical protein